MPGWVQQQIGDLTGLLTGAPERAKTEFQRLNLRVTLTPIVGEQPRPFYRAIAQAALPCLAGVTDLSSATSDRLGQPPFRSTFGQFSEPIRENAATDRLHPQAAGSRTSGRWGFRVDLPANQLGPGSRTRANQSG
jgi:hypothetical protein